MAQTVALLSTLKKALKAGGYTYADVARKLGLTEASVKRLFSERSFSLNRLDQVCQLLQIELSDLVRLMEENNTRITQLTEKQEMEIAGDITLLLVAICALNKWSMKEIVDHYAISENECVGYLARLDKLGIIDLLPGNRFKLLVAVNFRWLENGPIQRFFQTRVESDFFNSRFDKNTEKLRVLNGMLSNDSLDILKTKLEKLGVEFRDLNDSDTKLDLLERHGTTMVVALRQWEYGLFAGLRR